MQSHIGIFLIALSCTGLCFASDSGSPVEQVVHLLKDMQEKISADGAREKTLYESFSCWCTGMTSKKGAAIEQAKKNLKKLQNEIMGYAAAVSREASSINSAAKSMEENHQAQQTLTQVRDKENAAFTAVRAEMGQALQSLGQALKMLKMAPQFLQSSQQSLSAEAANAVRSAIGAIPEKTLGSLPTTQLSQLQDIGAAVVKGKYSPSYGSLVGILESMNSQISKDLVSETSAENTAKAAYESLMKTQVKELVALQNSVDKDEDEKAQAAQDLASTTKNYDDTDSQMNSDIKFFTDAAESCTDKAKAWDTRQKMRTEELDGVKEAISILSSDSSRSLFATAVDATSRVARPKSRKTSISLLQEDVTVAEMPSGQKQAFLLLKQWATKSQNVAIAQIAAQVRLARSTGHFGKVMQSIDKVIGVLKTEQNADNLKKTQCNKEYKDGASSSAAETWSIEKNDAKISQLQFKKKNANEERTATQNEIKDVGTQMTQMDAQRSAEKTEYDAAKKEDQDAIKLLKRAKVALLKFYAKTVETPTLELIESEPKKDILRGESAPEAKLSDKGSRAIQGQGIATLLQSLVDGLHDEIAVQTKVENMAIAAHGKATQSATDLQRALRVKQTNLEKDIADHGKDEVAENKAKKTNEADLKAETDYQTAIKSDCDFTINNWQERFNARKTEMDGLADSKSFLAGMQQQLGSGAALAQTKKHGL